MRLPAAARLPHGAQEEEAQPQVQGQEGSAAAAAVPGRTAAGEEGPVGPATTTAAAANAPISRGASAAAAHPIQEVKGWAHVGLEHDSSILANYQILISLLELSFRKTYKCAIFS